jgi:hypothetical protein
MTLLYQINRTNENLSVQYFIRPAASFSPKYNKGTTFGVPKVVPFGADMRPKTFALIAFRYIIKGYEALFFAPCRGKSFFDFKKI